MRSSGIEGRLRRCSAQFAYAYAAAQDTVATLHWLDTMLAVRDVRLQSVWVDPEFYFLRDDPRYRAWEAKLPWPK